MLLYASRLAEKTADGDGAPRPLVLVLEPVTAHLPADLLLHLRHVHPSEQRIIEVQTPGVQTLAHVCQATVL